MVADPNKTTPAARVEAVEIYKDAVSDVLNTVARPTLDLWSIFRDDALALSYFFDSLASDAVVLDVGTFVGVSAFLFACQPRVRHVLSIDPNPLVLEELANTGSVVGIDTGGRVTLASGLRVHDVAAQALAQFPAEEAKIELRKGIIAGQPAELHVGVPSLQGHGADRLVAFIDGLHTAAAVRADANAIFDSSPNALVFLDDCRYFWGPFVQAGIAGVLDDRRGEVQFKLISDVGVSLATCTLGLLYSADLHTEVEEMLVGVADRVRYEQGALHPLARDPRLIETETERDGALAERDGALARLALLERERDDALAQTALLRRDLDHIQSSRTWRMTSPLRQLRSLLNRRGPMPPAAPETEPETDDG